MSTDDPRVKVVADALMNAAFPKGHPGVHEADLAADYLAWVESCQLDAVAVVEALDAFEEAKRQAWLAQVMAVEDLNPGSDKVKLENTELWLTCHPEDKCKLQVCSLHNRTEHHMRAWPQNWRGDRYMMERVCEHGVGHPDPDDYNVLIGRDDGSHGCDGCCAGPD